MQKQDKKILILSSIIIIILIFGFFFFANKRFVILPAATPLTQEELQAERIAEVEIYDTALANKDFNLCKQLDYTPTRNTCFENVAKLLLDLSICENINTLLDKNRCIYDIIILRGAEAKSIQPCLELKEQALIERCQDTLQGNNFCLGEICP